MFKKLLELISNPDGRLSLKDSSFLAGGIIYSAMFVWDIVVNEKELTELKGLCYGTIVMGVTGALKLLGAKYGVGNINLDPEQLENGSVASDTNVSRSQRLEISKSDSRTRDKSSCDCKGAGKE